MEVNRTRLCVTVNGCGVWKGAQLLCSVLRLTDQYEGDITWTRGWLRQKPVRAGKDLSLKKDVLTHIFGCVEQ